MRYLILLSVLFVSACEFEKEIPAVSKYNCSVAQFEQVKIRYTYCAENTTYYKYFCYNNAIEQFCTLKPEYDKGCNNDRQN